MLEGTIIRGVGGFYYVKTEDTIYECRARGLFRKKNSTPLVGDKVKISITDGENKGYIQEIQKRSTELIRPSVANIEQAIIVFALKNPDPNLWLLDKFLLLAESQYLEIVICINKIDLGDDVELSSITEIYEKAGYKVLITSKELENDDIDELKKELKDSVSVFAGPSGVGKSTLLNRVQPNLSLKTGEVSQKTSRGKHTTRTTELLELSFGGFVLDTPGFSSLDLQFLELEDLKENFKEIRELQENCKFRGCDHVNEPNCAVKEAVEDGEMSKERYENYIRFYEEIKDRRRY